MACVEVGTRRGRLIVVALYATPRGRVAVCRCDCGEEKKIAYSKIESGDVASCGCAGKARSAAHRTHGMSESKEFYSWCNMRRRCNEPGNAKFHRYGARGIKVCDRWNDSFENFLSDMGPSPGVGYTIDRINNDGDYEPGNCRWANSRTQSDNRSVTVRLTVGGKTDTLVAWAARAGIHPTTVRSRLHKGWTHEEAVGLRSDPLPRHRKLAVSK